MTDREARNWYDNYSSDAHERALDRLMTDIFGPPIVGDRFYIEALPEVEDVEQFCEFTGPAEPQTKDGAD